MRIVFFGGLRTEFPRYRKLPRCFERAGYTVVFCLDPAKVGLLPGSTVTAPIHALQIATRTTRLFRRYYTRVRSDDCLFVGFNSYFDLLPAALIRRRIGCRVVYDPIICIYDTYLHDKPVLQNRPLVAAYLRTLERICMTVPDLFIFDTEGLGPYFSSIFGRRYPNWQLLPLGADDQVFCADRYPEPLFQLPVKVFFGGNPTLTHGVATILRCAELCQRRALNVQFTLAIKGQRIPYLDRGDAALIPGLRNVQWLDQHIPFEQLPSIIAEHDVCLGNFGTTSKVQSTIANKEYEAMAMGRLLVTARRTFPSLLHDRETAFLTVPGDAESLYSALQEVVKDRGKAKAVAKQGWAAYLAYASDAAITDRIRRMELRE